MSQATRNDEDESVDGVDDSNGSKHRRMAGTSSGGAKTQQSWHSRSRKDAVQARAQECQECSKLPILPPSTPTKLSHNCIQATAPVHQTLHNCSK
jgi:hypothetical protein